MFDMKTGKWVDDVEKIKIANRIGEWKERGGLKRSFGKKSDKTKITIDYKKVKP